MLRSLDRRTMKNVEYIKMYNEQIQNMVDRNVYASYQRKRLKVTVDQCII